MQKQDRIIGEYIFNNQLRSMLQASISGDSTVNDISSGKTQKETSGISKDSIETGLPLPSSAFSASASFRAYSSTESSTENNKWGRVDQDGTVYLKLAEGEKAVGQYPDASPEEALQYFAKKYDNLLSQVNLIEQRIAAKAPTVDIRKALEAVSVSLAEENFVGDIVFLRDKVSLQKQTLEDLAVVEKEENEKAKIVSAETRAAIVIEAEKLAEMDADKIHWKQSSLRINELLEEWKYRQKNDIRIGKASEDQLWERFRSARTVFENKRKQHFADLDAKHKSAKVFKEKIVEEAESLASSKDWANTAAAYRDLMSRWKDAPRTNRKDDDILWERLCGAQNIFFAARRDYNSELDKTYEANAEVKRNILAESQHIFEISDYRVAKKAFHNIQKRWEEAGKVPRGDMQILEDGIKKIEKFVKDAEDSYWRLSNPETKARTNSALSQLQEVIKDLESKLAEAEVSGNQKKISELRSSLQARKDWLEQIQKAATDLI